MCKVSLKAEFFACDCGSMWWWGYDSDDISYGEILDQCAKRAYNLHQLHDAELSACERNFLCMVGEWS